MRYRNVVDSVFQMDIFDRKSFKFMKRQAKGGMCARAALFPVYVQLDRKNQSPKVQQNLSQYDVVIV